MSCCISQISLSVGTYLYLVIFRSSNWLFNVQVSCTSIHMCMFIVRISEWVQQIGQLYPWFWNKWTVHCLLPLCCCCCGLYILEEVDPVFQLGDLRENSIHFLQLEQIMNNSAFLFHQVPTPAGWTEAAWNEKFAWHFYTWPAVGIEPQTFWSWVKRSIHSVTCSRI